jgi:hypothetical protein
MKKLVFISATVMLMLSGCVTSMESDPFVGFWQLQEENEVKVNIERKDGVYWLHLSERQHQEQVRVVLREGCLFYAKDENRGVKPFDICPSDDENMLLWGIHGDHYPLIRMGDSQ